MLSPRYLQILAIGMLALLMIGCTQTSTNPPQAENITKNTTNKTSMKILNLSDGSVINTSFDPDTLDNSQCFLNSGAKGSTQNRPQSCAVL